MACVTVKLVRDGKTERVDVPSDAADAVSYEALMAFLVDLHGMRPAKIICAGKTLHSGDVVRKGKAVMLMGGEVVGSRHAVRQPRWATTADLLSEVFSYLPFPFVRTVCGLVCRAWQGRNDACTRLHPQRYAIVGGDVLDLYSSTAVSVVARAGYRAEDVVFSARCGLDLYLAARPTPGDAVMSDISDGDEGASDVRKDTLFLDQLGMVYENTADGGLEYGPSAEEATLEAVLGVERIREVRAACETTWAWQRRCELIHVNLLNYKTTWTAPLSELLPATGSAGQCQGDGDEVLPLPLRRLLATPAGVITVQPDACTLYSALNGRRVTTYARERGWDHFHGPVFLPDPQDPVGKGGLSGTANCVTQHLLLPQGNALHVLDSDLHLVRTCRLTSPIRGALAFNANTGNVMVAVGSAPHLKYTFCRCDGRPLWSRSAGYGDPEPFGGAELPDSDDDSAASDDEQVREERAAATVIDAAFPSAMAGVMHHFSDTNVLMSGLVSGHGGPGAILCDAEGKHFSMNIPFSQGRVLGLLEGAPPDSFAEAVYMQCRDNADRQAVTTEARPFESEDELRDIALTDSARTLPFATNTSEYPKAVDWEQLAEMERNAPPRQIFDSTKDFSHPDNIRARGYNAFVKRLHKAQEEQKRVAWALTPKSVIALRGITRQQAGTDPSAIQRGLSPPLWAALVPFPLRSAIVEPVISGNKLYIAFVHPPAVGVYAIARDCGLVAWRRTWEQRGVRAVKLLPLYGLVAFEHHTVSRRYTSFFSASDGSLRHTTCAKH
eukprot:TRINITY_DN1421_c0_g1_i1.p1 TRINITY_DN1421_c0_g1~~TRINITY_DN1421_c0_g1_i1.p1  ORF type:complete len:780 (+),score=89.99 TRINITY_DN1421_c0_g1_i1:85-2424(+)